MRRQIGIVILICFFCVFGIGTVVCAENQNIDLKVLPDAVYPEGSIPARSEAAYYQSISDALSVAEPGDSIILMDNIEQSTAINNGYGVKITLKEITLDLNGKTYQDKANSLNAFQVEAGAKLIIKDNQGNGKITSTKARQCIRIEKDGGASIFSGSLKDTRTSGVGIENEGTLLMYGGSISGKEYGITCIGDPANTDNKTEIYDGAVASTLKYAFHVKSGNLSIFGGRFTSIKEPCIVIDDESTSSISIKGGIYNLDVSENCSQAESVCDKNDDQATALDYPWKVYPVSTIHVAAFCGVMDDDGKLTISESFGNVLGEGTYCKGDSIVLTAPVKQGWQFCQWYVKGNETWTALENEKESTCVINPDENCLMIAVYTQQTSNPLNLHIQGKDYSISGTLGQDGQYDGDQDFECEFGAVITLTAGNTSYFQYWCNESGKVTDQSGTYTFTAVQQDMTIKEKMLDKSESGTEILFRSAFQQVLSETVTDGSSEIIFPSFQPSAVGKLFNKWVFSDNQETATAETIIARVRAKSERNISIIPDAKDYGAVCDVILTYPSARDDSTFADQTLGKILDIFPDEDQCPQGKQFAYWTDENHHILSFAENYQMRAIADKTLTVRFLPEGEETAADPVLAWQDLSKEEKESEVVIHLTAARSLPEEDKILDQGFLYSIDPEQALVISETDVSKLISNDLTNNGSFTGHFHYKKDEIEAANYLYCRAYAVIRHQSEFYILYTEIKAVSL